METTLMHLQVIRGELECVVCNNVLEDAQSLTCQHNFCRLCIEMELRKAVSKCPKCSIPIRPSDVHRNQFLDGLVGEWKVVEEALKFDRPSTKRKLVVDEMTPVKLKIQDVSQRTESVESPELYQVPTTTHDVNATIPMIHENNVQTPLLTTPQITSYMTRIQEQAMALEAITTEESSPSSIQQRLDFSPTSQTLPPASSSQFKLDEPSNTLLPLSQESCTDIPPSTPLKTVKESPAKPPILHQSAGSKVILVPKSPPAKPKMQVPSSVLSTAIVPSTQEVELFDDEEAVEETEMQPVYDEETQAPLSIKVSQQTPSPFKMRRMAEYRFVLSDMPVEEKKMLLQNLESLGGARCGLDFTMSIDPRTRLAMPNVSHVITKTNSHRRCARTSKYLLGLAHQCWIVDSRWVEASVVAGFWVDEEPYEVAGDIYSTCTGQPKKYRVAERDDVKIFAKMRFLQLCPSTSFEPHALSQLAEIVNAFGGHFAPFVFAQALEELPNVTTIGIVSKSLSSATCKELWEQYHIPIVRITWIPDSISHGQALPYDDYYPY